MDHKSLFFPNKKVFNLPAFKSFVLTTFNFILQMLEKRLSVPDEQVCACVVNHNNRHFFLDTSIRVRRKMTAFADHFWVRLSMQKCKVREK